MEALQDRTSVLCQRTYSENVGDTDQEEMIWRMVQRVCTPPERIMELVRQKKPKPKKGQATIYELLED